MAEEQHEYSVTSTPTGHIEVRRADIVIQDGVEVSRSYHRHVVSPGDDLSSEIQEVVDLAGQIWTDQLIADYLASQVQPELPTPVPDLVSSRQFFMMLELSGLTLQVKDWVASQNTVIQIAFERSATFVRTDPMLQAGFAGLGVTTEQVDQFFMTASQL